MGKLVSESDIRDVLGKTKQETGRSKKEYERVEFLENAEPCVINTQIYPTDNVSFEIKMDPGEKPDFWMGCYDFTNGRKTSRFFFYTGHSCLSYDFPDDWGQKGRTLCRWHPSKPDKYTGAFPHVIEFGNKYIHDKTSNQKSDYWGKESQFSINAPFGLFGIIEYKGNGLPLSYNIPSSQVYKIYYFKAYDQRTRKVIAEMIPVKDDKGQLCMYDLIRDRYYYCLDEKGNVINEKGRKNQKKKTETGTKESFFKKKLEDFKYCLKREWNPKYVGGRLEIIEHGGKTKVVAYSTTDNDKMVVWNKSSAAVKEAYWDNSVIVLFCGFGSIHLYGPYNNDY